MAYLIGSYFDKEEIRTTYTVTMLVQNTVTFIWAGLHHHRFRSRYFIPGKRSARVTKYRTVHYVIKYFLYITTRKL